MERSEQLFAFEHVLLPRLFMKKGRKIVKGLLADKSLLYDAAAEFFSDGGEGSPLKPGDLEISVEKIESVNAIKIVFPTPIEPLLCYRAYAFYDDALSKIGYFGVARGDMRVQGRPVAGSWTKDEKFRVYCVCSLDNQDDLRRCLGVYLAQDLHAQREKPGVWKRLLGAVKEKMKRF